MTEENSVEGDILKTVFDVFPSLVFIFDKDVRIQEYNAAAAELLLGKRESILGRRSGEALHCVHSGDVQEGCGHSPSCAHCIIRNSVTDASLGNRTVRRRARIELIRDENPLEIYALISASPFRFNGGPFVLLVIEDISEIADIRRMIPICSVCKEIRDEKETWSRVEVYFKEKWDVDFSHGLCPKCYKIEMDKLKDL